MTTTNTPIVTIKNNAVVANSLDVAIYFGKSHFHVLRDIDGLIATSPACASSFGLTSFDTPMPRGGTRSERAFDMTRDGFTLLAMGFTGKKALQFKLRYIEQFNAMEAELKAPAFAPITATDVSVMLAQHMMDMQEKILAPLIQVVADLVQNQQRHSTRL